MQQNGRVSGNPDDTEFARSAALANPHRVTPARTETSVLD
jgi:hypothetical protein